MQVSVWMQKQQSKMNIFYSNVYHLVAMIVQRKAADVWFKKSMAFTFLFDMDHWTDAHINIYWFIFLQRYIPIRQIRRILIYLKLGISTKFIHSFQLNFISFYHLLDFMMYFSILIGRHITLHTEHLNWSRYSFYFISN